MKKIYWSLVFLLSINFGANISGASAQDLENLYYCNENTDIDNLFIINQYYSVGHVIKGDNYLVLFNHEHLPVDTLNLGNSKHFRLQHLVVTGTNTFSFYTLNDYMSVEIKAGKFIILTKETLDTVNGNAPDYSTLEGTILGHYIIMGDLLFLKRPEGNWKKEIGYSFYLFKEGKQFTLIENQKKVIEWPYSDFSSQSFILNVGKTIIIPVELANKMVVFDLESNKRREIQFPEVKRKKESWTCFYDTKAKKVYAVKFYRKTLDKPYEIYAVDLEKETFTFLETIEHKPRAFKDGKVHYATIEKADITNKEMVCHYLKPLGE